MSEFMNSIMTSSLSAVKTLFGAVQPRKGIELKLKQNGQKETTLKTTFG